MNTAEEIMQMDTTVKYSEALNKCVRLYNINNIITFQFPDKSTITLSRTGEVIDAIGKVLSE